ncbi:MAG: sterol desaturase family protein [Bacteroidetes Order II. Incertae sedis bacterium]|nr:sterol desaturase family protein [Bacteroidetes Order II. bacterium]
MSLLLWTIAGFCLMELAAYVLHRWVFHGWLWRIHRTHHETSQGVFEANDVFSVGFAAVSIAMMAYGWRPEVPDYWLGLGIGIAIYGMLYFIIHDLFTHKRFWPFKSDNKALQTIRRAHQRHHQTTEKEGYEPYGLFLFPYKQFWTPFRRRGLSPKNKTNT